MGTVKQYVANHIASDSEDESKIYRAENRAIKKRKMSSKAGNDSKENMKNKPSSTAPISFSTTVSGVLFPCRSVPQPLLQKQQFGTVPFRFGGCYVCGDFTHLQRECPLIARSRSSDGGQDKKQIQHEASDFVKDGYLIEHYDYQIET